MVAVDVFADHDGIIHDNAEGEEVGEECDHVQ